MEKDYFRQFIGQTVTIVYREDEDSVAIGIKCKVLDVTFYFLEVETIKGRKYLIKKDLIDVIKGGVPE